MGIVRDIITPILPVVLGIAIGAGSSQAWGWYRYTRAINAELDGRSQRDALVAALAVAQNERIKAEQAGRKSRQEIYAGDQGAKSWADQPVPGALTRRLHDAAKAADAASRPKRGAGVQATASSTD